VLLLDRGVQRQRLGQGAEQAHPYGLGLERLGDELLQRAVLLLEQVDRSHRTPGQRREARPARALT
jgi:hypothetical protein